MSHCTPQLQNGLFKTNNVLVFVRHLSFIVWTFALFSVVWGHLPSDQLAQGYSAGDCSAGTLRGGHARRRWCRSHSGSGRRASVDFGTWHNWNTGTKKTHTEGRWLSPHVNSDQDAWAYSLVDTSSNILICAAIGLLQVASLLMYGSSGLPSGGRRCPVPSSPSRWLE